jgi:hypothetical protein
MSTFKEILKRSNKSIQTERAKRICAVAKMEYDTLIANKRKEVFKIEDELEAMADISTSNVTTTANRISGTSFDAAEFVNTRATLKYNLAVLKEELEMLEEDAPFYG